jgi:hypothetical protein
MDWHNFILPLAAILAADVIRHFGARIVKRLRTYPTTFKVESLCLWIQAIALLWLPRTEREVTELDWFAELTTAPTRSKQIHIVLQQLLASATRGTTCRFSIVLRKITTQGTKKGTVVRLLPFMMVYTGSMLGILLSSLPPDQVSDEYPLVVTITRVVSLVAGAVSVSHALWYLLKGVMKRH